MVTDQVAIIAEMSTTGAVTMVIALYFYGD